MDAFFSQCFSHVFFFLFFPPFFSTAFRGSGGEVVAPNGDPFLEREAEPLRLAGHLRYRHHRQEAAAAAESNGAAPRRELPVNSPKTVVTG